ncbi:MAG: hypothetical protein JKY42_04780 [Flavobacteriales bacterium]|nr:hypothetical protein [Flavobacteriales bacterium]
MKKNVIIATLMLGTFGLSATGCSGNNQEKAVAEVITEPAAETKEVIFKQGKLIEVAFLSVEAGKEKQLNEEYFAKVMPVAMEYGMKPLLTIGVQNSWSENTKPQMVGFFEWPSIAKKVAFEKDERFLELKKIRNSALSFLKVGFYEVEKDMSVQLDKDKFYEIYGMTMNKEKGHLMDKYFEKAGPLCMNEYKVDFALSMKPVCVIGYDCASDEVFTSQVFGIAIWPNAEANSKYFSSEKYAEIKHYKEDALEQMDAWQGSVILK